MRDGRELVPIRAAKLHGRGVDGGIAELARHQHGVVARRQLLALGMTRHEIGHRLARGSLHAVYRGVYAVGHRLLSREGRWMAALLATGDDAVLSYDSAAALWGMRSSGRGRIDVTAPRALARRPTIELHRTPLPADEIALEQRIPVTTPPRTLLDLAGVLTRPQLERAIDQAEIRRLTDVLSLADIVERHPRRRGTRAIRAILDETGSGATITRSELEDRFLHFLDEAVLPRPEVNAVIEVGARRFEVDCLWRDRRLIIELDGHATHATLGAFERDRARDRILQTHGWRVIRITWRQLHHDPEAIAADLRSLLGA